MARTIAGLGDRPYRPTISPTNFASICAKSNFAMPKLMAKAVAVSNAIKTDIIWTSSPGQQSGHHCFHSSLNSA